MDNCKICKYWLADNFTDTDILIADEANVGFCRRYPPNEFHQLSEWEFETYEKQGRLKAARYRRLYPFTGSEDWCGEFKSK